MTMRVRHGALAALFTATVSLGGCGQTGPLYLPERGTVVTRPSPEAPAPQAPSAPPSAPAPRR